MLTLEAISVLLVPLTGRSGQSVKGSADLNPEIPVSTSASAVCVRRYVVRTRVFDNEENSSLCFTLVSFSYLYFFIKRNLL